MLFRLTRKQLNLYTVNMPKLYLLVCWFLMGLFLSYGQENSNFHFKKFQVGDGLSENAVYCIMQDSEGFMWFGTKDGLNRFDGTQFRVYQQEANKKTSLGNNFVRSIAQMDHENLVIGTDAGIYIMNRTDESFRRLTIKASDGSEITSAVNSLFVDKNGILWIGTMSQGVYCYDITKQILRRVPLVKYDLGLNATWTILEDRSGTIWAGTRLGLMRYNTQLEKFEVIENLFSKDFDNSDNEVLSILEDNVGNLWLGTWSAGLRCYNKQSKEFTSYLNGTTSHNYITHIRKIFQYTPNSLLIGSDDGLYLFNTQHRDAKRIDVQQFQYSLSDQNIYSISRDQEGGIWIGTYFGGINYLNTALLSIETFYPDVAHGLSGKAVSQFLEDPSGNLWIATEDGGLNHFDVRSKKITQPIKTSYHNTHALLFDDENLWIGTFSRGIDIYNTRTKKLVNHRYNARDSFTINDDCVFSLYKTKAGDIYIGTPVGLNRFDRYTNKFIRITEISEFIYDMKEDDHGNLWLASYGGGVIKRDAKSRKWTKYDHIKPSHDPIVKSKLTSIYIDSQRRIIFTSEGKGIFIYDEPTDDFKQLSEAEGLPNNVIYGVLDDPSGNLWLSCNKGLVCVDVDRPAYHRLYNMENGLQSNQFNYKSSYKATDGKFYFGGINGFNSFYPEDLHTTHNTIVPPVAITHINFLGAPDKQFEKEIQTRLNQKLPIEIQYNKSSFTISFVSLSYLSQSKNQYAYRLEGVDSDWNYVGNNKHVTYVNLAPGQYVFKVKASNNDGLWNEEGAEVKIEILPPFWLSLPAKVAYAVICFSLLWFGLIVYLRRDKKEQMRQLASFKAEQENLAFQSKIEFFTTIAHEIRTPLSLISAPLEEIVMSEEGSNQTRQNLLVIEKNCERLSVLINQLLDFRKMDSTEYIVNPEKINLKEFLLELHDRFKKTAQRKKIQFEVDLSVTADKYIRSDSDALTKIVGNLLTNALKFTYTKIQLKLSNNEDGSFTIEVADDGMGIPDDEKELIFDPFYQIQTKEENVGTGIGLSLVKHLAGVLNADVDVGDANGGGTVFRLTLRDIPDTNKQQGDASARVVNGVEQDVFPLNTDISESLVLVIDDNPDMTTFIKNCLSDDYVVDTAENGQEALTMLNLKNYNLIISDIMMPGIDGISLVKKIKIDINYSHIPVILLSAKVENSAKIEGLRSGADVFIEKPFSTLYLKAQISSLLKNRKAILDVFNSSPLAPYSSIVTNKRDEYFIDKLNEEIERHISDENFTVESLTDFLNISRSNLQRKLKSISGHSPGDYLRNYRLKKACQLLLESDSRINEVAFRVGFNSASYFTKVFYKTYNMLPKEFINHHMKNMTKAPRS